MKAPVTLSSCGAFVVYGGFASIPNNPAYHPSIPVKTVTVPDHLGGVGCAMKSRWRMEPPARATLYEGARIFLHSSGTGVLCAAPGGGS